MVIDSSALVAILLREPEALALMNAINDDTRRLVSVFSVLETSLVIEARKGESGRRELDTFLQRTQIIIVELDVSQLELAREAWRQFGKGHHPAKLNIGDCCSYALAKFTGEPLLFKGKDFSQTDLTRVSYGM
jgi:ribonuclease VapC